MGAFAKAEIVLFPFPYTDLSNRKLRPCLVLSDEMGDDVLLCQITSKKIRKDQYTVEIKKDGMIILEYFVLHYQQDEMMQYEKTQEILHWT